MFTRTTRGLQECTERLRVAADGPCQAMKKFGFDPEDFFVTTSRKGFGHYAGRVEIRSPEAQFSARPTPPDFVLIAID